MIRKEILYIGGGLAAVTFLLTFIAGLFGGVPFGLILLRSLLFCLLLGAIGIGGGFVLDKLAPGVWDSTDGETSEESVPIDATASASSFEYTVEDGGEKSSFSAPDVEPGAVESMPVGSEEEHTPLSRPKGGKQVVGNFLMVDDKKFPNDPEEYAKAVRTMLNRDD